MNFPIIVYTHTDMKDVWPMFFGQLKKYIGDAKVYVAVNEDDTTHLSDYIRIIYDDSKQYTERWKQILSKIKEETIMFIHEDMILYDYPLYEQLNTYSEYIANNLANSIKLIYGGNEFKVSEIDNTLVSNQYSKISIQPTLIKQNNFVSLLNSVNNLNIWEFEKQIQSNGGDYMVKLGTEKKRGLYHYDSVVFPYIATAINKGKWNMSEYSKELDSLFIEYKINPFERGIV